MCSISFYFKKYPSSCRIVTAGKVSCVLVKILRVIHTWKSRQKSPSISGRSLGENAEILGQMLNTLGTLDNIMEHYAYLALEKASGVS